MSCSNQTKGFLLTAAGVLILTPDALLVRLISCDAWTLLFWRGLLQFSALFLFYSLTMKSAVFRHFKSIGMAGLLVSMSYAAGNILFVNAIRATTAANTLLIVSCAPIIAAIMSAKVLGEKTTSTTQVIAGVCLAGRAIIFSGDLSAQAGKGELLALATACCMATSFVMIRKNRTIAMIPAVAISGALMSIAVLPLAQPFSIHALDAGYLFILGFIIMPLAFGLITIGPRYLTAPEVSLIMLIETILGPVWVWLVLDEKLPPSTLLGGSIVLTALILHAVIRKA